MAEVVTYDEQGTPHIRLSYTAVKAWSCPKRFWFSNVEMLKPKERVQYFDVGQLGHAGLARYFHPSVLHLSMEDRYRLACAEVVALFEKDFAPNGASREVLEEVLSVLPAVMQAKIKTVPVSTEEWLERPITTPEFIVDFVGKIDLTSVLEKDLYVEEHKFLDARGFGEYRALQNQESMQTKGYVFLTQGLKQSVKGVIHNFFLKMKSPKLEQRITLVGPRDLSRFEKNLIDVAREVHSAHKNNHWRENIDDCYGYSKCPFVTLCEFGDNEEIRKAKFEKREPRDKFMTVEHQAEAA